jgi:hypothetical protein
MLATDHSTTTSHRSLSMRCNKDARSLSNVTLLAPPLALEPNLDNSSVRYMTEEDQNWTTVERHDRREQRRQPADTPQLRPSSLLVPPVQVEDSPAGLAQTACCIQLESDSFLRGRGTRITRDLPQTLIGNPISPSFILNSSLSASRSRCPLDILGLVTLRLAPSQLARSYCPSAYSK